jgi:transcriptional regulator with GAF, ATPase, and Fis domain
MENVLIDLIEAVSRAHTEATFTQAAFDALVRHLPIASVELVLAGPGGSPKRFVAAASGREVGAGTQYVERSVPLMDEGLNIGRANLLFKAGAPPAPLALLEDLGRVLSAALRQLRALARVAKVSRRAHVQSRELGDRLKELLPASIIAASPSMRRIFGDVVPAVAKQPVTVLLLGETGTGKEVVARRIHEVSPRARRVYLRINCGAIPPTLLESALFGHERGAFTGASRAQAGVFERAHEGTLLLDEVGELSPDAQVRLLRVLESGELERVGGHRTERVDVRVVAATHRDLEGMTADGRFRRDLFYRLSVFPIRIPPLRERLEDIEPMARHILERLSRSFGEPAPRLERKTIQRLRAYGWPGNVRELENVLARSLLLSRGALFQIDLPSASSVRSPMRFEEAARRCIADALAASAGRIYGPTGAAAILGLKPTTLVSKMQRLGVASKDHARRSTSDGRRSLKRSSRAGRR